MDYKNRSLKGCCQLYGLITGLQHGHGGVHVQLQHGVQRRLHPGRAPEHVPLSAAELSRAADDGELPDRLRGVVAAGHDERAAVVRPRGEQQRDAHDEHGAGHGARHVGALRAAGGGGVDGEALREEVVDGHRVAEVVARVHGRVLRAGAL
ncbi:unnamed protein product [Urochloa humidicola]